MEKAVSIFPDAANGFEKAYEKLRNEQLGNLEKQSEKFVDSEIELRKELYSAAKAADWLRSKYKVHPKSCEILLQNLFFVQHVSHSMLIIHPLDSQYYNTMQS